MADRPKQSNAHDCVSLLPAYLGNQVANPPGHSTHPSLDDYPRAHLWPASETSPLPPFTTFLRPNLQGGPAQHQNSLVPVLVPVLDVDSFPTSNLSRLHHQGHSHINSPLRQSHITRRLACVNAKMNVLLSQPPVFPHQHENNRLSPSRSSMFSPSACLRSAHVALSSVPVV